MQPSTAAQRTADAILDAQSGFPSKERRAAVQQYCLDTERRISALENEVAILRAHVAQLINRQ